MGINWGQAQPTPLKFWNPAHSRFPVNSTVGHLQLAGPRLSWRRTRAGHRAARFVLDGK